MAIRLFAPVSATTEIEAVNIMLATIGESPINSFEEITGDVAIARNTLMEISKAVQLEGWQWNTEDNYPLKPDVNTKKIKLDPSIFRVYFPEPHTEELVVRGGFVYDRMNHTFVFDKDFSINVRIVQVLPFDQLPESARAYIIIRAARVFQERVVGSKNLSAFTKVDEGRARAEMMAEERQYDRPNILKGTLPPTGTYRPVTAIMNRGGRHYYG